jgi:hypothetical protein
MYCLNEYIYVIVVNIILTYLNTHRVVYSNREALLAAPINSHNKIPLKY